MRFSQFNLEMHTDIKKWKGMIKNHQEIQGVLRVLKAKKT